MAAIITEKFRTHSAKQFIEDFGESASSTYMFIGRSYPWTDDTSPPSPQIQRVKNTMRTQTWLH